MKIVDRFEIVDGPMTEIALLLALSEGRSGRTVVFTMSYGGKYDVTITGLDVPTERASAWRIRGTSITRGTSVESSTEPTVTKHGINEFEATFCLHKGTGKFNLGQHLGYVRRPRV